MNREDIRKARQKRSHWRQDTPREQMVALTQAIQGWVVCFDAEIWTPELIEKACGSIRERCEDLFELSKWVDSEW